MKQLLLLLTVFVVFIVLFGCVNTSINIKDHEIPEDLDQWLSEEESKIEDLVEGTEKKIFWAGEKGVKTEFSIIYIHGYTASRQELSPVFERVAKNIGANIFLTRLKGHGTTNPDSMKDLLLNDWANDTYEAYEIGKRIGSKVIAAGMSTGAPLVAWLATREKVDGLVLGSPNFAPADGTANLLMWPVIGPILPGIIFGEYREFEPVSEEHAKYFTERHHSSSLHPMMASCNLGKDAPIEKITAPSLFVYTENDDVISIPTMEEIFERIPGENKKLVNLKNAHHHNLSGTLVVPETVDEMVQVVEDFIREYIMK